MNLTLNYFQDGNLDVGLRSRIHSQPPDDITVGGKEKKRPKAGGFFSSAASMTSERASHYLSALVFALCVFLIP
jgi:hypothetical protein